MKKSLFIFILARCALVAAGALLLLNQFVSEGLHAWLSSLPLALAGVGYILLQIHLKPTRETFWKRVLLAGAFLLWAVVQVMPSGRLAIFLGDTVIAAYVVDLVWMMRDQQEL